MSALVRGYVACPIACVCFPRVVVLWLSLGLVFCFGDNARVATLVACRCTLVNNVTRTHTDGHTLDGAHSLTHSL